MIYQPTPSTKELLAIVCAEHIQPKRILDLCCGSGWFAEALADKFPSAEVWAADIRDDEFTHNPRINWNKGDLFEGLAGTFDLIICNPPYLPSALWDDDLQPRIAYDGGWNGFQFIARFISELPRFLPKSDYLVALESFHAHHLLLPGWEIVSGGDDVKRFAFLRG